jgi:hypothetical protein
LEKSEVFSAHFYVDLYCSLATRLHTPCIEVCCFHGNAIIDTIRTSLI